MNEGTLWTLLTVESALGILFFGWVLRQLHRMLKEQDARYACPFLRFGGAPVPEVCRALFARFRLFYLLGLVELAIVLLVAAHNTAVWPWLERIMMGLCALAWSLATAEAICTPRCARAAAMLSRIKWMVVLVWVTGLFVGLVCRGWALSV